MAEDNKNKISPASIDKFLAVQEREITLREKELNYSMSSKEFDHEFALKALDAQVKDNECIRKHESSHIKYTLVFAGIVIICLLILFLVAIRYNKDQIVMEVLKAFIYVGAGGLGGYSIRPKNNQNNNTDNQ